MIRGLTVFETELLLYSVYGFRAPLTQTPIIFVNNNCPMITSNERYILFFSCVNEWCYLTTPSIAKLRSGSATRVCSVGGITLTGKGYTAVPTDFLILLSSILEAPKPDSTTNTIIIWTKGTHVQRLSRNQIFYSHCTDFYNALLFTTNFDYRRFLKIAISEYLLRPTCPSIRPRGTTRPPLLGFHNIW